jgi:hypothetical protein
MTGHALVDELGGLVARLIAATFGLKIAGRHRHPVAGTWQRREP